MPWVSKKRLAAIENAERELGGLRWQIAAMPVLVSIEQVGRVLRFIFQRNGTLHTIETYSSMDATPEAWRRDLLG